MVHKAATTPEIKAWQDEGSGIKLRPINVMVPPAYALGGIMAFTVGKLIIESVVSELLVLLTLEGLFI